MSLTTDPRAVIPPSKQSANLTVLAAAAMGFLAVLAIAVIFVGNRLAESWTGTLSGTATLTLPAGTEAGPLERLQANLATIPGLTLRPITGAEQAELLTPWLGEGLRPEDLPLPVMFELTAPGEIPAEAIRKTAETLGIAAELDTHERWRDPLTAFARRIAALALGAGAVILMALVSIVTLASEAALAANLPVIRTLRLVGASDTFIARAFVRRFTLRALMGAAIGTVLGLAAAFAITTSGVLGPAAALVPADLPWLLAIPALAAITAFVATRLAAMRALRKGL